MDSEEAKANRREAFLRGSITFLGMPCIRCGSHERKSVDGRCAPCHRKDSSSDMQKLRKKQRKAKKAKE